MKIVLAGSQGQLGLALQRSLAPLAELVAFDRQSLDFLRPQALRATLARLRPQIIVNAAAYTAVDRAEREPEVAQAVNSQAVEALAGAALEIDALLVHFSTDYVFDGAKPAPYVETDATNPLGVYGRSKLAGDRAIEASGCRHFIFRTSWVYSPGGRNFVNAILAAAQTRAELRVVNDQRGAPTSAATIAGAVARILAEESLRSRPVGVYHLSSAGETSWYEFARLILDCAGLNVPLRPVSTAEYGAAAPRPRNSLLDNAKLRRTFGIALPDWRQGWQECEGLHEPGSSRIAAASFSSRVQP